MRHADGSMAVGDVVINGVTRHFKDTEPTAPTYVFDNVTETYQPIEGNTQIPYGAEIAGTTA